MKLLELYTNSILDNISQSFIKNKFSVDVENKQINYGRMSFHVTQVVPSNNKLWCVAGAIGYCLIQKTGTFNLITTQSGTILHAYVTNGEYTIESNKAHNLAYTGYIHTEISCNTILQYFNKYIK